MPNFVWFNDALAGGTGIFTLTADKGAYALTGHNVGPTLFPEAGAYVLSGNATLYHGFGAAFSGGAYALTGGAIGPFVRTHLLVALRGEYKLTAPRVVMPRTKVPVQDPTKYVEGAWVQPENENNLDADVEWESG